MIKIWAFSLACVISEPGLAAAGSVAPILGRITAPVSPTVVTFGAAGILTSSPQLGTPPPSLGPSLPVSESLTSNLILPSAANHAPEMGTAPTALDELILAAQATRPQVPFEETSDPALLDEAWRLEDPRTGFAAPSVAPLSVNRLSANVRAAKPKYEKGDTFTVPKKDIQFDDADTVTVSHRGKKATIRFGGVDAPEIAHPGKKGQPQTAQPYGTEAAAFLKKLISRGKSITVTVEDMDMYGRVVGGLALNLPDGKTLDVQQELVRAGWAWQYVFYNRDPTLERLQTEARNARRGLWQGLDVGGEHWPEPPWIFRRREKAGIARILPGTVFKLAVGHMPDADTLGNVQGASVYGSIRLAGVDAPEVAHPGSDAQPYGAEAAARARELVKGKTVTVTVQDTDKYGRLVAWIKFRSGAVWRDFHKVLLQEGWAWWYQQYYPEHTELGVLEKAAREAGAGLWQGVGRPDHMPPWQWRDEQRKKHAENKPPQN